MKKSNLETSVSRLNLGNSNVSQTGCGAKPLEVGQFFGKTSYFNNIGSHSVSIQSHLKQLDFQHLKVN